MFDVYCRASSDCLRKRLSQALIRVLFEKECVFMKIVVWKSPKALCGLLRRLFGIKE
jgi:hypothetical protein